MINLWVANVGVIVPHHGKVMVHDKIKETYVVFTILMRNDHTALVIGNQESQRFLQPPQTPTKPWRVGFLIKFYAAIQNCYTSLCKALI